MNISGTGTPIKRGIQFMYNKNILLLYFYTINSIKIYK